MNVIRKSAWMFMILGVVAGCAGETADEAPAAGGPGVTKVDPTIPGPPPIPTKGGAMKGEMKGDEPPAVEGPKAEVRKSETGAGKLNADEVAAIKELPAADQALASKQVVCPVSNHNLGSMGKPIKVTAEGKSFYICCDGCEDKAKADAKAIIAKLEQKGAAK